MLVFMCGKMGSGKSTISKQLAADRNGILLSEDEWLEALYPNKIRTLDDYIKYSGRLKPLVKKLAQSMLTAGATVVMDFPANTIAQREWFRDIFSEIGVSHELIYIDMPDDVCLKRISQRHLEQPERVATDTEEMFWQVTKYFVAPSQEEGFNIVRIDSN